MIGLPWKRNDDNDDWLKSPDDDSMPVDKQFRKRVTRETRGNIVRWELGVIAVILLGILYYLMNPAQTAAPSADVNLNPAGKTQAWALTEQWLADKPLGDDARVISWNGSKPVTFKDGSKTIRASVHTLTVDSALGWWKVDTTVRSDGELAEYPSPERIEVPSSAAPNTNGSWGAQFADMTVSDSLDKLIVQWGAALVGDDNDLLTVVMKDPDPNASYQALALGKANTVAAGKAAYLNRGKVDRNNRTSDRAVVRVNVTLEGRDEQSKQTQIAFDVLVADPDGSPKLLAWGAPGTGPTLKEHANRLPSGSKPVDMTNLQGNGVTGGNKGSITDNGGGDTPAADAGAVTVQ